MQPSQTASACCCGIHLSFDQQGKSRRQHWKPFRNRDQLRSPALEHRRQSSNGLSHSLRHELSGRRHSSRAIHPTRFFRQLSTRQPSLSPGHALASCQRQWGKVRLQKLDGVSFNGIIPATLRGSHRIEVVLDQEAREAVSSHRNDDRTAPGTPEPKLDAGNLSWPPVSGAASYELFRDSLPSRQTKEPFLLLHEDSGKSTHEYQVEAIDSNGISSFLSAPVVVESPGNVLVAAFDPALRPIDLTSDSTASAETTLSVPTQALTQCRFTTPTAPGPSTQAISAECAAFISMSSSAVWS